MESIFTNFQTLWPKKNQIFNGWEKYMKSIRFGSIARVALLTASIWTWGMLHASDSPKIGIDSNENRVVIWQTFNTVARVSEVRSAIYNASTSTWSTFANPISSSTNAQSPILVVHSNGDAVAIWSGEDPITANSAVQAVLYDGFTSTWGSVVTVSPSDENACSDYQATIDSTGLACIVWTSFSSTGPVIRTATVDFRNTVVSTQL